MPLIPNSWRLQRQAARIYSTDVYETLRVDGPSHSAAVLSHTSEPRSHTVEMYASAVTEWHDLDLDLWPWKPFH